MFDEKNKEDFTGKSERNKIGRIKIKILKKIFTSFWEYFRCSIRFSFKIQDFMLVEITIYLSELTISLPLCL